MLYLQPDQFPVKRLVVIFLATTVNEIYEEAATGLMLNILFNCITLQLHLLVSGTTPRLYSFYLPYYYSNI